MCQAFLCCVPGSLRIEGGAWVDQTPEDSPVSSVQHKAT